MRIVRQVTVYRVIAALALVFMVGAIRPLNCFSQEVSTRKVKTRVEPVYPEIAKRMHISGTVKLEVVVGTNGSVKDSKAVGGHPLLVNAATDAVKRWKFEPATTETSGTVEFTFAPSVN